MLKNMHNENRTCGVSSFERIYEVVKQIPEGKVASYGQVAALAGNRRWARVVGYALHACPDFPAIPCHRVVTKEGGVSPAFADVQTSMLLKEGVKFKDGHVIMENYQWDTPWLELGQ